MSERGWLRFLSITCAPNVPQRYFREGSPAQVIDTEREEVMARHGCQDSGGWEFGRFVWKGVKRMKKVEEGRWKKIGGNNWKK